MADLTQISELTAAYEGVNKVQDDGRVRLVPELAKKFGGQHVAMWEDDDGRIILEAVEVDDGA